jgi:Na+/citrate or Na+/malate symporter
LIVYIKRGNNRNEIVSIEITNKKKRKGENKTKKQQQQIQFPFAFFVCLFIATSSVYGSWPLPPLDVFLFIRVIFLLKICGTCRAIPNETQQYTIYIQKFLVPFFFSPYLLLLYIKL